MARRKGASPAVAARWEDRVARHCASGLSVADFCRRERVHPVTSYGWRKRLAGASNRGLVPPVSRAFLPIRLVTDGPTPTPEGSGHACELVLGSLVCRVPRGLDDVSLRRLISALPRGGLAMLSLPCVVRIYLHVRPVNLHLGVLPTYVDTLV